jgi:WD40 repeat protein
MMKKAKVEVNKIASLTGHRDCIYTLSPSLTDKKFLSAGGDGLVVEWEPDESENGQLVAEVANSIYAISLIPGTSYLAVGQNYEGIHIIDMNEKKEVGSLKIGKSAIFDMCPIKNVLFIGDSSGTITLIDLKSLTILKKIKKSTKSVRAIVSNGKDLAAGYSDNRIRIFDLDNLSQTNELKNHSNSVFTLKYSPDNKFLLSGGRDAHLNIWDTENNYSLNESIIAHMYAINSIVYSPEGRHFATCSMDKTVKIWNTDTRQLIKVIDRTRHGGHSTSVNKLFWSSYKNRLISCSDDRSIALWDLNFNTQA